MGLTMTLFHVRIQDIARYWPKIANVSEPRFIYRPADVVSHGTAWLKNYNKAADREKVWSYSRFNTINECDRRTDGHMRWWEQLVAILRLASRGKKKLRNHGHI